MFKKLVILFILLLFITSCSSGKESMKTEDKTETMKTTYPQHEPYGEGTGVIPGRVVWAYDKDAVNWDGNGYWWETKNFDEDVISKMLTDSIISLAGEDDIKQAWNALFEYHNKSLGKSGSYSPGEKIAIKVNINGSGVNDDDSSGKTNLSYTNAVLLKSLLKSLVGDLGAKADDIFVYDVSRIFPDYLKEICSSGELNGVSFVGRNEAVADQNVEIIWSREFDGPKNYLPTCVTEAEYLINLASLKGHSYGITLAGKNHFGSFLNSNAMRPPQEANLHQWLTKSEMGIYSPLVDLMANENLGRKTVLNMLDGLICAPSEGIEITKENSTWRQDPFNGDYTASILVSQDPVAIDSVAADILINEPTVTSNNSAVSDTNNENYLHEAGLVSNPPSKTIYQNGLGEQIINLGVHEHWNNSTDKNYSRNLGESEGIELIKIGF